MTAELLTLLAAFAALAVLAIAFTRPIFEDGKWLFAAIAGFLVVASLADIAWSFFLYGLR